MPFSARLIARLTQSDETPLGTAFAAGQYGVARVLLAAGADLYAPGKRQPLRLLAAGARVVGQPEKVLAARTIMGEQLAIER